ncbi:MAG: HAD-IA family hydrolase [Bacteroidetes bacterium]|nr:HAD-IA family hydrolase [Bacteroidota bacterium]
MIKAIIFDWGDTVMRDYPELKTPMFTWEHVEYIPDVEQVLRALTSRYTMVIATNAGQSDTAALIKALKRVGAEQYFHHFFSSKDLGYEKPDVRFFTSIAQTIYLKPEECIMIGNLYEKDITGAKDAGMKTILFDKKASNLVFPKADKVIHSMKILVETVKFMSM